MKKVYLVKDVEKIGMAGEIVQLSDGLVRNFILPRKLGMIVTKENEEFFNKKQRIVEQRSVVVKNQTSMLAERIRSTPVTVSSKMHDNGKLYGSVSPKEIVEAISKKGINVSKNQVIFNKLIKEKGRYEVSIKLSSRLKPKLIVKVVST